MNIVYLTNQYPPNIWGGMGIFVSFLAEKMSRDNRVWIYTTNPGYLDLFEDGENIGIYRPVNPLVKKILGRKKTNGSYTLFQNIIKITDLFINNIDCFFLMKKNMKKDGYDIVVVHDFMHSLAGILCIIFLKIPVVFHVHFIEYTMTKEGRRKDFLGVIRFFENMLSKRSKRIIAATGEMKDIMVRHGWDESKIRVVPLCNVKDLFENFSIHDHEHVMKASRIRKSLGISGGAKTIVYVGRLVELKGVFSLLKSMKTVAGNSPDVRLVLVGEGNRKKLDGMVSSLGIEKSTFFYHKFLSHEEVLLHYLMADICIFPSIQEPFGLVALEAMSAGRPVILGNGFSRIFEGERENPCVLYADPHDPDDIAAKITGLLDDEEAAMKMGLRAMDHAKRNFSQKRAVELMLKTYGEALEIN